MTKQLTKKQRHMLDTLRSQGPMDIVDMRHSFGLQWYRAWVALQVVGLVAFNPDAKDCKQYAAETTQSLPKRLTFEEWVRMQPDYGFVPLAEIQRRWWEYNA